MAKSVAGKIDKETRDKTSVATWESSDFATEDTVWNISSEFSNTIDWSYDSVHDALEAIVLKIEETTNG